MHSGNKVKHMPTASDDNNSNKSDKDSTAVNDKAAYIAIASVAAGGKPDLGKSDQTDS